MKKTILFLSVILGAVFLTACGAAPKKAAVPDYCLQGPDIDYSTWQNDGGQQACDATPASVLKKQIASGERRAK